MFFLRQRRFHLIHGNFTQARSSYHLMCRHLEAYGDASMCFLQKTFYVFLYFAKSTYVCNRNIGSFFKGQAGTHIMQLAGKQLIARFIVS